MRKTRQSVTHDQRPAKCQHSSSLPSESNRRPAAYETAAATAELERQKPSRLARAARSIERMAGIEPGVPGLEDQRVDHDTSTRNTRITLAPSARLVTHSSR